MTRHPLKQMHASVGASAHAGATTSEKSDSVELPRPEPRSTKQRSFHPFPQHERGRSRQKSELWQRRAGVVIGNRSPARIGAYHSIFGRTECAPTALVGRNRGRGYKVLGAIVRTRQGENVPVPAWQAARDR